jgi:hypothetical protein
VRVAETTDPDDRWFEGTITAINSGPQLVIEANAGRGTGTYSSWTVSIAAEVPIVGPMGGLPYAYSTPTLDPTPDTGKLKFDTSSFGSVTNVYIHDITTGGLGASSFIGSWGDSTSTPAGYLIFGWGGNNPAQTIYSIVGEVTRSGTVGSGYSTVPVSFVSGYVGAISNGLAVRVAFTRNGDVGPTGPAVSTRDFDIRFFMEVI